MAGKGPLDNFYKDALRFGNLKVSSSERGGVIVWQAQQFCNGPLRASVRKSLC